MKRRLLVALCLLAVMALAGTFIIRTNSSTSPTDEVTAVDSQATPPTAQSTPSTTIDPRAATKGGEVEKAVHQQIKKEGTASVVISLDVPVTSSVTETAQRTTRAIDEFLAQLPPGSYSNVDAAGVLPVLTLTLKKIVLMPLRKSASLARPPWNARCVRRRQSKLKRHRHLKLHQPQLRKMQRHKT